MRRTLALLALAATAALASPAQAGPRACTPSTGSTTVGACVDVVCLKLCVTQIEVDTECSLDRPVPLPVYSACAQLNRHIVIGG